MAFWNVFKKQLTTEEAIRNLDGEVSEMDRDISGFDYDLDLKRAEREQIIRDGVDAYNEGDEGRSEELQEDLELLNNEVGRIEVRKSTLRKKRYLYRQAATNLKYAPQKEKQSMQLLEDPELMKLVNQAEINEDSFRAEVEKRYHVETAQQMRDRTINKQRNKENPFKALAEAMKSGDPEKVARAKEAATGKKPTVKESRREDDLLS